jgi:hypothetical protein
VASLLAARVSSMTPGRRGSLIAATWLIGLGLVFLIRELADLSWAEAWPMFVILVAVGSFVSTAVHGRFTGIGALWGFTGAVAWAVIGVVLLLSTTGNLGEGPIEVIVNGWPWLAVGLGIWYLIGSVVQRSPGPDEALSLPLAGAGEAAIRIRFGAGELSTRAAAPGQLVDGEFRGGVSHKLAGPGRVQLEQDTSHGLPWIDRSFTWTVGLTAEVPLDLRVDAGASRNTLDLRGLRLRSLELHTGASETRVVLPEAAGATSVRAETGAASLTLEVPDGVAARIRTRMVLGSVQIDEFRFPQVAGGYESRDYATAANQVDIDVQGGVGSLRVRTAS